jgi:hypothetical protein
MIVINDLGEDPRWIDRVDGTKLQVAICIRVAEQRFDDILIVS